MGKLNSWINERMSVNRVVEDHLTKYYAPKNFNFFYFFGSLAMLVLVNQIVTGIWLTMSYEPSADGAFASVEYIMRDVEYGWLLRYMHSTGASAFFVVIYLHMFRGLIYGSYQKPRELLWLFGMLIFLLFQSHPTFFLCKLLYYFSILVFLNIEKLKSQQTSYFSILEIYQK